MPTNGRTRGIRSSSPADSRGAPHREIRCWITRAGGSETSFRYSNELSKARPPLVAFVKAADRSPRTNQGDVMQYLVSIYHPDDYDGSREDDAMRRDIDALNEEMVAADVRRFVGGL